MQKGEIIKIGDTVECCKRQKAVVEKIRIISTAEFVGRIKYNGKGDNVVLTLRDSIGVYNFWLKDSPICILEEKKEKKKKKP